MLAYPLLQQAKWKVGLVYAESIDETVVQFK